MTKTNAMRILDSAKIEYTPYEYVPDDNDLTGVHIAEQIGLNPDFVFKTLVARGDKSGLLVFCIPCNSELDLKKCAKASGDKKIELLPVKELLSNTGYIRGGCSPIGMKKLYPTYFDETCQMFDEIAISAGERGHQMIIPPMELIALVGGKISDIIV